MKPFVIVVHGGAGTITRQMMSAEKEALYTAGLNAAIEAGATILEKGGSSLDAVEAAVIQLENNHLFNAGKGSVFNSEGRHQMDAAIMRGDTLEAGAVTGISTVQNPVSLARNIMEHSGHVFLSGPAAEEYARLKHIPLQPESYFFDEFRHNQWIAIKDDENYQLDHSTEKKFGTVGAVALDKHGNLASATSTGGMTNKRWGRIGDSPIIGSGTYANNITCAISCTGHGELFMRAVVAHDVSCLMEYKGLSLEEAGKYVVNDKLVKIGGEGGLIAIDKHGNISLPFNSEGMYRGWKKSGEAPVIRIYKD